MKEMVILKVSGKSNCKSVAGSLSHFLKGDDVNPPKNVEVHAIGAAAVNQAVKALAISSGHLSLAGQTLSWRAGFNTVLINGEERTVIIFNAQVS